MAPRQGPVKLARIGLALELEDGSKVMVYADQVPEAQVTITTETPAGVDPWDPWERRRLQGPPVTSILIEGLGAYLIKYAEAGVRVSAPGRGLEAIRREVTK